MKYLSIKNFKTYLFTSFLFCFVSISSAIDVGNQVPFFDAKDIEGKVIESESVFSKGPSIVFFWHSCCGLDNAQMNIMKELYSAYKDKGLTILGIATDGLELTEKVKSVCKVTKMPWNNVVDDDDWLKNQFTPSAIPSVYIIEKGGKLHSSYSGYNAGDDQKQKKEIEMLIKG